MTSKRWRFVNGLTKDSKYIFKEAQQATREHRQLNDIKKICRLGMAVHSCIPNTLGGQGRQITRSRDQDNPGQHGETTSLIKIQKLADHGGVHL